MVKVFVTGIGLISCLGTNIEDSWQKLIAGKSGIQWHQPFPELEPLPLGLIGKQPAGLRMLTQLVVASALKDAGLVPPLPDCAVVIGSSRSHQACWESLARQIYEDTDREIILTSPYLPSGDALYETLRERKLANAALTEVRTQRESPRLRLPHHVPTSSLEDWLDTLPHMNAIATARQIGSSGTVLAPMAACATGIWTIAQAAFLVQTGQCQRAIAGAVETPITPLTIAGFQQMGALAKTGAYPFDLQREGLVLGEGAAVFVLESAELARQRQARVYGEVLGFGLTTDAYHPNQPEPEGKSAISAIQQCLERSSLAPADIDYIHAHGTATQLNDRIESKVIQQLFTHKVAVSSTKGATGHTLGASGALGIAFSLLALQQKILPPCVGLRQREFNLNLVMAARQSEIQQVLCFSFGFGGQNAVVALGNSPDRGLQAR